MGARDIAIGFDDSERIRVGSLYWEAFHRKLQPAFADEETGLRIIRASLRAERMFVARVQDVVVGVCGFMDQGIGATRLSWVALKSALPLQRAVRAALATSVLARSEAGDRLVLDGICVDRAHRGGGIGTALLGAAEQHARERGLRAVRLSVVDSNPRAEALYRRRGFTTVDGGSLGLLGYVYGFDRYTVMEKEVSR